MALLTDIQDQIIELYIGTFNRAPDASGLAYWVSKVTEDGWSTEEVAESMFDSEEVAISYPDSLSDSLFIEQIYQNVLGRNADAAGLSYWVSQLSNGISRDQMIVTIINGAKADTGSDSDAALLTNKTEVARFFALDIGSEDLSLARSILTDVTDTDASRTAALDELALFKDSLDASVNLIEGTESNDTLGGSDEPEHIYALGGDDTINAGGGNNIIYGGSGSDNVYADGGNDQVFGRSGDDTIYSGDGDDLVYGDEGHDSLHLEAGDDEAYGGDGDDFIYGYEGDDLIKGGAGDDSIFGGAGSNMIYGGDGNDRITTGDDGNFVESGTGDDIVYGGAGIDRIYGGYDEDVIYGFAGNDILEGHSGDDRLYGGEGDDQITGSEGFDALSGGAGSDTLNGEEDSDRLHGGTGADTLTGGSGSDLFVFYVGDSSLETLDIISDFHFSGSEQDRIQLVDQGNNSINGAALDVSSAGSLLDCVNLAAGGDGSINSEVSWFNYEDSTYIVQDLGAALVFDPNTDILIKLQGVQNLSGLSEQSIVFA